MRSNKKYLIGMSHFGPLPGDPRCKAAFNMDKMAQEMLADADALQRGGADAIMFSNEASQPWMLENENHTACAMAAVLGRVIPHLRIPFGVHVIWDAAATITLAAATGAAFAWEAYGGVYASDYGLWNTQQRRYAGMLQEWGLQGKTEFLCEVVPEAAAAIDKRALPRRMQSLDKSMGPFAFCVAGLQPGMAPPLGLLQNLPPLQAKVFTSTGMRAENIVDYMQVADGAIVGSAFKKDGSLFNPVDQNRVSAIVAKVRSAFPVKK